MTALPSTEDLARLAKAITPGPWRRNLENTVCNQIDGEHHAICTDQFCYAPEEQQDANAEAIALLPALIREVLDRREAESWQPIETAPKDGTAILASGVKNGKGPSRHYSVVEWMDFGFESGWYPDEDSFPLIYLTHWMPLPEPPGGNP